MVSGSVDNQYNEALGEGNYALEPGVGQEWGTKDRQWMQPLHRSGHY